MKTNKQKAFTLIELLVVISVVALLSVIALVSLNNARIKARDTKRMNDLKIISKAIEMYYIDEGDYPVEDGSESNNCGYPGILSSGGRICDGAFKGDSYTYIDLLPQDPINDEYYFYAVKGGYDTPCIWVNLEGNTETLSCQMGNCKISEYRSKPDCE
ncbi:MAG: type II secretion system protein [Patescibacteria group bacterium]|nr:type II secretion system protein [Patescibacteria group bacterium]